MTLQDLIKLLDSRTVRIFCSVEKGIFGQKGVATSPILKKYILGQKVHKPKGGDMDLPLKVKETLIHGEIENNNNNHEMHIGHLNNNVFPRFGEEATQAFIDKYGRPPDMRILFCPKFLWPKGEPIQEAVNELKRLGIIVVELGDQLLSEENTLQWHRAIQEWFTKAFGWKGRKKEEPVLIDGVLRYPYIESEVYIKIREVLEERLKDRMVLLLGFRGITSNVGPSQYIPSTVMDIPGGNRGCAGEKSLFLSVPSLLNQHPRPQTGRECVGTEGFNRIKGGD